MSCELNGRGRDCKLQNAHGCELSDRDCELNGHGRGRDYGYKIQSADDYERCLLSVVC